MNWLVFALMTVVSWGVYGIFLHAGQVEMKDSANGRYKAFLFVGVAYFLTAVLAPLAVLLAKGADWDYPKNGMGGSLVAGIAAVVGSAPMGCATVPSGAQLKSDRLGQLRSLLAELFPGNKFYAGKRSAAGVTSDVASLEDFAARFPFTSKAELVWDHRAPPPFGS